MLTWTLTYNSGMSNTNSQLATIAVIVCFSALSTYLFYRLAGASIGKHYGEEVRSIWEKSVWGNTTK